MDYCNQEHYRQLPADATKEHTRQLNRLVKTFDPVLQSPLRTVIPRTSCVGDFYCLPKIHKANTPGCPTISGNRTQCENLSGYVKGILKPIVQGTPSFCHDTTDFLQKLSIHGPIKPGTILITMDVSALYTSIPHEDGIAATASASIPPTANFQAPSCNSSTSSSTTTDRHLSTSLYHKPTDNLMMLHFSSFHPKHIETAISYGQALHLQRI
eukprot:g29270.t1